MELKNLTVIEIVEIDGVAPRNYHSTSMYPEYYKINGG